MGHLLLLTGSVLVGNYVAERFVMGRFVPVSDGFGLDDVVRSGIVAGTAIGVGIALKKAGVKL